jgi:nanoRNase/pAp phosphatase (c-di-AMP/oligoRNAs hydrolase)
MTLHPDPDYDSLFSNFAMKEILEKLGKKVEFFGGDTYKGDEFEKLTEYLQDIHIGSIDAKKENELLLVLDINRDARISKTYEKGDFDVMVFDHHIGNSFSKETTKNILADEEASSTCEMAYLFAKTNNVGLSEKALRGIYAGIYSDTVGFTTELSENTLNVVDEIREKVDVSEIIERTTKTFRAEDFQNFSEFLKGSEVIDNTLVAIASVNMNMRKATELASRLDQM